MYESGDVVRLKNDYVTVGMVIYVHSNNPGCISVSMTAIDTLPTCVAILGELLPENVNN